MIPSDTEALASARAIRAFQQERRMYAILILVIGIAISLIFPPALIAVIIGLIVVCRIHSSECRPHESVLQQFAQTRNWYHEPSTELRNVEWQKRRVRFYCTAPLLSINSIADYLILNDFVPRTPPPTGEVPRKRPQYTTTKYTHFESTRIGPPRHKQQLPADTLHILPAAPSVEATALDKHQPPSVSPHIPPAGWTTTPVAYAVPPTSSPVLAGETNRRTSAPKEPPAALPFIPPAGWNLTPVITFLHDGSCVGNQTSSASRNEPLITPVISQVISPNRAVEIDQVPPFALEQQVSNTQAKRKPPQRKPRKPSEVITKSIADLSPAPEGGRKPKTKYAVVRSVKLRKAAIQIHGRNCSACGFNFDETFGEILSQGYIEIHHLNSIAAGVRNTDPATDLAPLCGNCHAMADRLTRHHAYPPRSIGELRKLLFPASSLLDVEMHSADEVPKSPSKTKIGKNWEKKSRKGS